MKTIITKTYYLVSMTNDYHEHIKKCVAVRVNNLGSYFTKKEHIDNVDYYGLYSTKKLLFRFNSKEDIFEVIEDK